MLTALTHLPVTLQRVYFAISEARVQAARLAEEVERLGRSDAYADPAYQQALDDSQAWTYTADMLTRYCVHNDIAHGAGIGALISEIDQHIVNYQSTIDAHKKGTGYHIALRGKHLIVRDWITGTTP